MVIIRINRKICKKHPEFYQIDLKFSFFDGRGRLKTVSMNYQE
ncbi:hypothetical protein NEIMUCOT_05584 [Neisseria mucosa ATCC 25996]|uniref:Uncharacterized protein n=1 Tax=Neisseria mucosa (strain ATCC 25996 / DSM 4631 / NCTC 10774 / M26) TaxID=546266 RepID=D2ZY76_NEIM2|nr:hypothetical protein [Neisseria sicca]EFC88030.1 hypothetical protein NEIMUCOT_05584 [Neisseria mucosa ATCC 25996]